MKVVLKLVMLIIALGVATYGICHQDDNGKIFDLKWLLSTLVSLILIAIACII